MSFFQEVVATGLWDLNSVDHRSEESMWLSSLWKKLDDSSHQNWAWWAWAESYHLIDFLFSCYLKRPLAFSLSSKTTSTTYCLETNSNSSEPSIEVKAVEGGPHVTVLNNGALWKFKCQLFHLSFLLCHIQLCRGRRLMTRFCWWRLLKIHCFFILTRFFHYLILLQIDKW